MRTKYVHSSRGREFFEASKTEPDQSYTVKELLTRYTSGTMPPVSLNGNYDDELDPNDRRVENLHRMDDPFPEIRSLDFTEIDSYQEKLRKRIDNLKSSYEQIRQNFSGQNRAGSDNGSDSNTPPVSS